MAQCLVTFPVITPIEPSLPITVDGIMDPGLPPHTPYLGTPVVFPPGQRPVSFCFGYVHANGRNVWPLRPNFPSDLSRPNISSGLIYVKVSSYCSNTIP